MELDLSFDLVDEAPDLSDLIAVRRSITGPLVIAPAPRKTLLIGEPLRGDPFRVERGGDEEFLREVM